VTAKPGRLIGVDLARFLAIVGMMAAHLLGPVGKEPEWLEMLTTGFPSTLFAVLGGFGVVFASRKYQGQAALLGTLTRGGIVFALGWLLEFLPDHNIAVVLIYFGAAIMVSSVFLTFPTWALAISAAVIALIGGQFIPYYRLNMYNGLYEGMLDYNSPSKFFGSIFITGTYPVLTWIVYLLIGMIFARWILKQREKGTLALSSGVMAIGGIAVSVSSWLIGLLYFRSKLDDMYASLPEEEIEELLESANQSLYGSQPEPGLTAVLFPNPHSGSLVDILHTAGGAIAVIGLCILLTSSLRNVPIVLRPFTSAGSAPLTIYILHITMTSFMYLNRNPFNSQGSPLIESAFWWQSAVVLAVGVVLAVLGKRGPFEALTSISAGAVARSAMPVRRGNMPPQPPYPTSSGNMHL